MEDTNIQALLRILDMVPDDFRVLAAAFEEDGNVEIDGIIEVSSMGEVKQQQQQGKKQNMKQWESVDLVLQCFWRSSKTEATVRIFLVKW